MLSRLSFSENTVTLKTHENTIDIRKYYVEDAITLVEKKLDSLSLKGVRCAYIIHGHGSGRLRAALQDYLKTCPYVNSYKFAESYEGGKGVTIVSL